MAAAEHSTMPLYCTGTSKQTTKTGSSEQLLTECSPPAATPEQAAAAAAAAADSSQPLSFMKVLAIAPQTPPLSPKPIQRGTCSNSSSSSFDAQHFGLLSTSAAAIVDKCRCTFEGNRVLIISGGTRGDVQPATALGVALAGLGARVCLAADSSFQGFVVQHGLSYFPLGGDAKEMMAVTVKWGGMLPNEFSGMSWLRGQIREVMDSVWAAAQEWQPDIILANQLAYGQVHVAEKLGVPLNMIYTIPWLPTTSIAHPWARAWGHNITEYINAAAEALLKPGLGLLARLNPKLSSRLGQAVLPRVAAAANWLSTPLLDHTAWWGIADLMTGFRHKLGLPLLSTNNTGLALYRLPTLCMFSSSLVPRPADWGDHITLAGFLSLSEAEARFGSSNSAAVAESSSTSGTDSDCEADADAECSSLRCSENSSNGDISCSGGSRIEYVTAGNSVLGWQPSPQLLAFLEAGPAPIYIGFGSMVVLDAEQLVQTVLEAALELPSEQRVILCTGWSGAAVDSAWPANLARLVAVEGSSGGRVSSARVFCIAEAPHDWLFPRCSALVHHGGVGTTAVGLRCGKPTLVVPAFGDLFFWGDVCYQMGVGPAPIPLDQLNSSKLLAALQQLVHHQSDFRSAAEHIAAQLVREDGLAAAVSAVARTLASNNA